MSRTHTPTLVIGMLAMAAGASGQTAPPETDGGPVVVGTPRESWTGFQVLHFDAALEFRVESTNDKQKQNGQPTLTNRETRYRELVDLSGEAIVGHRNLLDITGTVQFGLEDIYTKDSLNDLNVHETDFLGLYDVSALILGTSYLPTTVYARRDESKLDRPFAGSIDETLMEEGIRARIQSMTAPTSFQYFHRDDQLTGDFGNIDTRVTQDSVSIQNMLLINDAQRLTTDYAFDAIDERQKGGYSDAYDRHDLNVVHLYTFGGDAKPHELRSSVRVYDQSGKQEQDRVRWDELLTLRHSSRLETRYSTTLNSQDVRGQSQQLERGEASIKYRLFDSLTSVGTVGAQRLEAPENFTSDNEFISGQLDYTKLVPLGRLDASGGVAYDMQQNSERGSTIRVIDEPHTFVDGFAIILPRRNIVAGSIVVAPVSGFPIYQEGLDYSVTIFTDHAEIRGIVGGGFVNGQSLRVSYDIGPEQANDVDTVTTNFSIRYSINQGWLKGLALYSTYRTVGHTLRADDPTQFQLDDLNDLLLGTEYRFREFDLRYEYNIHDSTFDPYTLQRLQALYSLPLGPGSSVNAEWTREIISFDTGNNDVTFDRGSLKWITRLSQSLDVNVGLEYRQEDSSLNGTSEGFDQILGFTWHKRQTTVFGSFRNSNLDGPSSNQTSQYFQFGFRRTF